MSTPPVPPGRPEDLDDPTGVRALLAGLGDPGPMPADLVDRINASIAAEQQARSAGRSSSGHPSADPRGTVVPLRRRLPSWPKVGLAAAAVAAVAVAVPALAGTGPGELLASLSGTGSSSASSAAGSAAKASPDAAAGRKDAGEHSMSSSAATVTLQATGTAYTSSALRTQARTVLAGAVKDHATPSSALRGSSAGAATADAAGLRECLTALGVAASMPLTADVATYDGRPAVVVVVGGDTRQSVYAVAPDCDADHPAVMAGPVPLG
ncbi:hypothetical protein ABEG17_07970 [Pedococcus sp. KACC 23699]|uniref:Uncharacterized protein n=1 Tax=Pedococcus sp. KACC 23699 TaxID=3149228 RepID=A0AAU7JYV2_9MICO